MKSFQQIESRLDIEELISSSRIYGEEGVPDLLYAFLRGGFQVTKVKENPKRKVFLLQSAGGKEIYLKLFAPQKFPFNIIRFYGKKEYAIARELEKASVPVVRYIAWGKAPNQCGFCLSEGVKNACPARRFFFESACSDPGCRKIFLSAVEEIVHTLHTRNFHHPDFHTGNLLYAPEEKKFLLVDPWGIGDSFLTVDSRRELCGIWMELKPFLSEDEILSGIISGGLAPNKMEALVLMDKAYKVSRKKFLHHKEKLNRRILKGHKKYVTLVKEENKLLYFRNNLFFAPPELPAIDPAWRMEYFADPEEAKKIFLDSFDIQEYSGEVPLLMILSPTENAAQLYFPSDSRRKGVENGR